MDEIDIYNNSAIILNNKTPKSIISWITILIILIIVLLILFSIPFNIFKSYVGNVYIKNNESYVLINQENCDFPIINKKYLYIKNKKYKYEITEINQNLITIKLNIEDKLKIQNNIVIINIIDERTTMFKILKNKIKKGLGL